MTKREAGWLLYAAILVLLNYSLFRLLPGLSWWLVAQIVLIGFGLLCLNVWLFWTQINAVAVATDDQTPFDDKQASNDMGWTYYAFNAHYLMIGVAIIGVVFRFLAPEWPSFVHENMMLSWPVIFNAPVAYAISKIDRGTIAAIMQRIVSLRMRNTRFGEPGVHS